VHQNKPATGPVTAPELQRAQNIVTKVVRAYSRKVVGQENLRTSLLIALMTGGHVLLESVPGLAKTTAAQTLADTVHADFKRIQCTPDLLPSDIIGTQVYDNRTSTFTTRLGPVHANFVLLDEINRSSAKTQSAMLEAMQERQTTIGGEVRRLPDPFLVIATQNPIEQEGTYELPEAQLDRFLLKDIVPYSNHEEELEILRRIDSGVLDAGEHITSAVSLDDIVFLQNVTKRIHVSDAVANYIVSVVQASRDAAKSVPDFAQYITYGASPRASIGFMQASRALALMKGKDAVYPDDVKELRHVILRHRIGLSYEADIKKVTVENVIDALFASVIAP
jgi:MoxR-like ATPase